MEFSDRIPKLIAGWLRNTLTTDEATELNEWVSQSEANKAFFIEATDEKKLAEELRQFNRKDVSFRLDEIINNITGRQRRTSGRIVKMKRYMIAACIVLFAGSGIYFLYRYTNKKPIDKTVIDKNDLTKNDIAPASDKTILTLADGSTIALENSDHKKIDGENGMVINQDGAELVYNGAGSSSVNQSTLSLHTLSTARGGQFRLLLADGSKCWLNSMSSIRFPPAFKGKERNVEITGEAYFEVAHDAARPFTVSVNGMKVQVLGTHFNINGYVDEETINTTVLEGSVRVSKNSKTVLLKSGQQARLDQQEQLKLIPNADIEGVIAWKNGVFNFDDADVPSVLRQVARWYDIDVEYKNGIPQGHINGKVPRSMNLSEILKILEYSEVNFKLEGRKLIVMP